jgi:hypothetical protein
MKAFLLTTRWLEGLLGAFFIFAAFLKALDLEAFAVQVSYYRVVTDPALVRFIAYGATALETIVGACLIAGIRLRGLTYAVTAVLLVGFTGLVAYAWQFHGIEECGCFGAFIATGPPETIAKNVVMMLITIAAVVAWRISERNPVEPGAPTPLAKVPYAIAAIGLVIVAGGALTGGSAAGFDDPEGGTVVAPVDGGPRTGPYANFVFERDEVTYDLGRGEWLVALFSADCEHCMASVPSVNELLLFPDTPPIAGLMFGDAQQVGLFRAMSAPEFPTFILPDQLAFFDLLGNAPAPPSFVLVSDGAPVARWNDTAPEPHEVLEAMAAIEGAA